MTLHHCIIQDTGDEVAVINMADHVAGELKWKRTGHYKEYLHHYNPYKFKAARRTNRRKLNSQKNGCNSTISHGDFNKSDTEFDDSDVFMVYCLKFHSSVW